VDTTYFFDAVIATDHHSASRFTDHPIQSGASVTDHIYELPSRIVLEVVMSDVMDSFVHGQYATNRSKSISAYQAFKAIKKLRTPLKLTTRLETYENVQIEEIHAPDTNLTIAGLRATIVFKQFFLANIATNTVSARPAVSSTTNKGTEQAVAVSQAISAQHQIQSGQAAANEDAARAAVNAAKAFPNPRWCSNRGTGGAPFGH